MDIPIKKKYITLNLIKRNIKEAMKIKMQDVTILMCLFLKIDSFVKTLSL